MAQEDPEERIAELERQLSDAKSVQREVRARPAGPANVASASYPTGQVPQGFDVHHAFQAAPYGSPFSQAPGGIAIRNYTHRMRVTSYLWLALWLPGIFFVVQGINVGAKDHQVTQSGHTAFCGNAFDYAFGNNAFDPFINGGDLRQACDDQLASAQPMTWGLIAAGAALILGSVLVVVVYRINRWRRGWRPWRIFGDIYPGT